MKKKTFKSEKLSFDKFTIVELNNLKTIIGGVDKLTNNVTVKTVKTLQSSRPSTE